MMATLREKYGPEAFAIGGRGPSMYWFFDEQGARASGVPARECAYFEGIPRVNEGMFQGRIMTLAAAITRLQTRRMLRVASRAAGQGQLDSDRGAGEQVGEQKAHRTGDRQHLRGSQLGVRVPPAPMRDLRGPALHSETSRVAPRCSAALQCMRRRC
jgi:hypothetical protein